MLLPQPSEMVPHAAPWSAQVFAVQPQAFGTPPPPHVSGALHVPQSSTLPQPSETWPQLAPSFSQVVGVQAVVPHLFAPSPPQKSPVSQLPQSITKLQPSGIEPHSAPKLEQVPGLQPPSAVLPPSLLPASSAALAFSASRSEVKEQETVESARPNALTRAAAIRSQATMTCYAPGGLRASSDGNAARFWHDLGRCRILACS